MQQVLVTLCVHPGVLRCLLYVCFSGVLRKNIQHKQDHTSKVT